jgi:hypothetical protein
MLHRSLLAIIFLCTATMAFAHGEGGHVLGTVTTIDQQRLAIKTQTGAIVEVQLNKQTRFKDKGDPKGINQPAVGDRVVVETVEDNNTLIATEVHFSAQR